MKKEMSEALREAVIAAIESVGIDVFKSTSMFMSNNRRSK